MTWYLVWLDGAPSYAFPDRETAAALAAHSTQEVVVTFMRDPIVGIKPLYAGRGMSVWETPEEAEASWHSPSAMDGIQAGRGDTCRGSGTGPSGVTGERDRLQLVEKWRRAADICLSDAASQAFCKCADELEQAIGRGDSDSAAPDLLSACKDLLGFMKAHAAHLPAFPSGQVWKAEEAIAKAEGK